MSEANRTDTVASFLKLAMITPCSSSGSTHGCLQVLSAILQCKYRLLNSPPGSKHVFKTWSGDILVCTQTWVGSDVCGRCPSFQGNESLCEAAVMGATLEGKLSFL